VLTVAYSARFVAALVRPSLVAAVGARAAADHAPTRSFVGPAALLAAGSVALGVAPALWSGPVGAAASALDPRAHAHLELWHGWTTPLLLSAATLAAGAALFAVRRPVARLQERVSPRRTGQDAYEAVVRSTLRGAALVTSVAQSGSLPIYAAVVLGTAAVVPTVGLLGGAWWPGWPELVGRPAHLPIAALLIGGGMAATLSTRRFAAAILLGVVGYGMAILFVVQGAPDLALTQFAVETLSVVVFLLVLRRLPDRFERRAPAVGTAYRVVVSAAVGLFVVLMGIGAAGSRTEPPVSRAMAERALTEGEGRNVVNVILVDIRGMDTLGEITVLVAAALGITALARAGRDPSNRPPRARPARRGRRSP
jgi:multicomponent Na+:H+ antiporter subunit A